uniref:Uncharacterized protein n=1 Tax=Meloidogyne enterolobii TaxID=390850 RepID=A0A6V7X1A1_MELEN|nr:unnamed protein product [Meloidogyne enterolobii]
MRQVKINIIFVGGISSFCLGLVVSVKDSDIRNLRFKYPAMCPGYLGSEYPAISRDPTTLFTVNERRF